MASKKCEKRRELNYDTTAKNRARKRGLKRVLRRKGTYLTLASAEGFCVQDILAKNPNHVIHNVESKKSVLAKWRKKNLIPNEDNFKGQFSAFIRSDKYLDTDYRLLNLDLMGYVCGTLDADLRHINRLHNAEHITLTQSKTTDKLRTTKDDEFRVRAEKRFSGDVTLKCLKAALSNYDCVEHWEYKRDKGNVFVMRMFMFKRKKGLK